MKLSDFKGIKNKSTATVISVENRYGDYWVVKLKPDSEITWRPGEHAVYSFSDKGVTGKKWRAFSVASIPEEGYIMIGTRTGTVTSSFKQKLINLSKGDKVNVRGPFGWFLIQEDKLPVVMIAGGVGITPIRALVKELEKDFDRDVELVFSSKEHHLFSEEFLKLEAIESKLNLSLTETSEETISKIIELAAEKGNDAYYYVSGNMKMIKSTRKLLKSQGIKGSRIINDPFLGY